MNQAHLELLRSELWRDLLRDLIVPYALGDLDVADLGDDVLECGPGPGATTRILTDRLPKLTVIELDGALARDLRQDLGDEVEVHEADATAMPFDDASFSAVVCFTMLHHVPSVELQDRLFAEARRVLRPGGLFLASDSVASPELAELHHGDIYNPVDVDGLRGRLTRAGFTDATVRSNDFGWACHARRGA